MVRMDCAFPTDDSTNRLCSRHGSRFIGFWISKSEVISVDIDKLRHLADRNDQVPVQPDPIEA